MRRISNELMEPHRGIRPMQDAFVGDVLIGLVLSQSLRTLYCLRSDC